MCVTSALQDWKSWRNNARCGRLRKRIRLAQRANCALPRRALGCQCHRSRPWKAYRGTRVRASQYQRGYNGSPSRRQLRHPAHTATPALGRSRPLSDPGLGSGLARIRTRSDPSLRLNRLVDRPPCQAAVAGPPLRAPGCASSREPCRAFAREFASVVDRASGRG